MRRFSISLLLFGSIALLASCTYIQPACSGGGCGYVSTPSYVTTSGCCTANKTYVVKTSCCTTNCCPTCNRCAGYYSGYYGSAWDPGYGYGYGAYNTGWY